MSAEMKLTAASKLERDLEGQRADRLATLQTDQQHWAAAVSGVSLQINLAGSWARSLERDRAGLARVEAEMRKATEARLDREREVQLAGAYQEAAKVVSDAARRRHRLAVESALLNELADRTTRRRP